MTTWQDPGEPDPETPPTGDEPRSPFERPPFEKDPEAQHAPGDNEQDPTRRLRCRRQSGAGTTTSAKAGSAA